MAELALPTPVFIVGTLRSGASLLSLSLSQHSAVTPVLENPWLEEYLIGLVRAYRAASRQRATSQIDINGFELEAFLEHFGKPAMELISPPSAARFAVDSTPANLFLIAPLRSLFPEARFIHIVRDVTEVVASLSDPEMRLLYKSRHIECTVPDAYDHWLRGVSAGIEAERAFGSHVIHRVRRQDLLRDPAAVLTRCFEFLDLEFDPGALRPFSSVTADQNARNAPDLRVSERTSSTADALSAMLTSGDVRFPGDELLVDRLQADFWRKATTGRSLVPPIPGTAAANNQQRARGMAKGRSAASSNGNGSHGIGRFVERLLRDRKPS